MQVTPPQRGISVLRPDLLCELHIDYNSGETIAMVVSVCYGDMRHHRHRKWKSKDCTINHLGPHTGSQVVLHTQAAFLREEAEAGS